MNDGDIPENQQPPQAQQTTRKVGKSTQRPAESPTTETHKNKTKCVEAEDVEMQAEPEENNTSSKLSELYVSDDMKAFLIDRSLEVQRKIAAKDPSNNELTKKISDELQRFNSDTLVPIIFSNTENEHVFSNDAIITAIQGEIRGTMELEINEREIAITPLGRTGPYVVALRRDCAHILTAEGSINLVDVSHDLPVVQKFSIRYYMDQSNKDKERKGEQDKDEQKEDEQRNTKRTAEFSIFFNLPVEYTGNFFDKGQLSQPVKRVHATGP